MSALEYVHAVVIPAALSMLPPEMDSPPARAMLLATGLQESRFVYRRQIGGPARGFWMFELGGGFASILTHPATRDIARDVLTRMGYTISPAEVGALEHNDILECIGGRLLLWAHPGPLPRDAANAWGYYLATWRPGKPHRETWDAFYAQAWDLVNA